MTATSIHPAYYSTTATTVRQVPHGIICTIRSPTTIVRYNSRFLSTTTTDSDIERYLCQKAFLLGSFDYHIGETFVKKIKQLANKKNREGVRMAFQLLDRLFQEAIFVTKKESNTNQRSNSKSWRQLFNPHVLVYQVVVAWIKHCNDSTLNLSPKRVFEMVKQWETDLPDFRSTVDTYNMIIHATVSLQEPELAEEILHHLLESDDKKPHKSVDAVSLNCVIKVWANSGQADAPQKAKALLKKMIELSSEGLIDVTPDVITYNSVILAWANSNHDNAPYRAEDILLEMIARGLTPNHKSYSSLLTTWARSKANHATDHAAAILKLMVKLYKKGVIQAKPDAYCFSVVISAFASCGDVDKAEQLFADQVALFRSTKDRDFLPSNAEIISWATSGRPEAPHMADMMLWKMQDLAVKLRKPSLMPDAISFSSVLNAWAQSKDDQAPYRCKKILKRMDYLCNHGHADLKPNIVCFKTVIDSWAKSSKQEAPDRAEAMLRRMQQLHGAGNKRVKPT